MAEGPLTPIIPASEVPEQFRPSIEIRENKRHALEMQGDLRADSGGDARNHRLGIFGEHAVTLYVGNEDLLDTEVYADGGDGGIDLQICGNTVDVKTASREQTNPRLLVRAYDALQADYYVLVNRIGAGRFKLVGYCPRHFVANAETKRYNGEYVHVVPQDALFPFPVWNRPMSFQHVEQRG